MTKLDDRLSLMANRMTVREPFIASIFAKLPRRVVEQGTAWTNGSEYVFAADFCDKQDDEELFGLTLHETMHVVFMHMWRRGGRNPAVWNIANDAVINAMIKRMGYRLPEGGVDIPWVSDDMDSDVVYNRLMKEVNEQVGSGGGKPDPSGNKDDDGAGGSSGGHDGTTHDKYGSGGWDGTGDLRDAESNADRADMEATIMASAKMAKACGDKSLLVQRLVGSSLAPIVNWVDEVRTMMTSSSTNDFTYRRVNRRMLSQNVYLPAMYSEAMGGMVVAIDTSGSVGGPELDRAASEITSLASEVSPEFILIVYCDSQVLGTQRFERDEKIELKPLGGGGTAFKPVFDYVDTLNDNVACLIYLTDMCGDLDFGPVPNYPVIWGNFYGDMGSKLPFGKEVRVHV